MIPEIIAWIMVASLVFIGCIFVWMFIGYLRIPRCSVSGRIHDYHLANGGDGMASYFHEYTCSYCGEKFGI